MNPIDVLGCSEKRLHHRDTEDTEEHREKLFGVLRISIHASNPSVSLCVLWVSVVKLLKKGPSFPIAAPAGAAQ
jgi:hypothetical protein